MTYVEKLKDPRWQKKRLEILEAAGWECISCGASQKTLHVHHKLYIKGREPWEYDDDQLECLCEDCHERTGAVDESLKQAISSLDEAEKLQLLGYIYARLAMTDASGVAGPDHDPLITLPDDENLCMEWVAGFGDFFGLSEPELLSLAADHNMKKVRYGPLYASWFAKIRRKPIAIAEGQKDAEN